MRIPRIYGLQNVEELMWAPVILFYSAGAAAPSLCRPGIHRRVEGSILGALSYTAVIKNDRVGLPTQGMFGRGEKSDS